MQHLHFSRRHVILVVCLFLCLLSVTAAFLLLIGPQHTAPRVAGTQQQQQQLALPPCIQPPANLDLSTLSLQDLARYGLPTRSDELLSPVVWLGLLRQFKHRSCRVSVPTEGKIHAQQLLNGRIATRTAQFNGNTWAGAVASSPVSLYQEVDGLWTVPCLQTNVRDASSSAWVGLGNDAALVQAGVDNDVDAAGKVSYQAWAETFLPPSDVHPLRDYQVLLDFERGFHCGDQVFVSVTSDIHHAVDQSSPNTYFLGNLTTGEYQNFNPDWPAADGLNAEWIVEQPTFLSGQQFTLKPVSHFDTITFQYSGAYDPKGGLQPVGRLPYHLVSIDNGTGALATARLRDILSVEVTWQRAL